MKKLLLAVICLSFALSSFGQVWETLDITTYQAPKGWTRQAGQDSIQFSIGDKDSFCLITLFRSVPGFANPKENFDAAWATIVKPAVPVSAAPQMMPSDSKGEWQITGGFAPFENGGNKGVAMLLTASGFGRMVNALILTNTQAYEPPTTAFLNSISFKKPVVAATQQAPVSQNGSPPLAGNFWKQRAAKLCMPRH